MKKYLYGTALSLILMALPACNSKVEKSRIEALETKADALDNKAAVVRKNSSIDAADQVKQTSMEADAAMAAAKASNEVEKKNARETATIVRQSGEQAAKALELKANEARKQKNQTPENPPTP